MRDHIGAALFNNSSLAKGLGPYYCHSLPGNFAMSNPQKYVELTADAK